MADPVCPSRYFCSHKAGVHAISLPMVSQLAELCQAPTENLNLTLERPSVVQHLVCTQLFSKKEGLAVQGLAVSFPPAQLHCLMGDLKAITLTLPRSGTTTDPQPLLCQESSESANVNK